MNVEYEEVEYYICGIRPVKILNEEESIDVLVYNWDTGGFSKDLSYYYKAIDGSDSEKVTEDVFNARVEQLRGDLFNKKG